jgi:hypothetical protein
VRNYGKIVDRLIKAGAKLEAEDKVRCLALYVQLGGTPLLRLLM